MYRLYDPTSNFLLPFPFASEEQAEKHLARIGSTIRYEIRKCVVQAVDEETALEEDDIRFEARALDHFMNTGKDLAQG